MRLLFLNLMTMLTSCVDPDDPYGDTLEKPKNKDNDCYRSIHTDECIAVPHEEDGKHSLCENDFKRENSDCYIECYDGETKHIIDCEVKYNSIWSQKPMP